MDSQVTGQDTLSWIPKVEALRSAVGAAVIKSLGPLRLGPDTPPLTEKPAIVLRDSMIYRAESVGFHIDLLKQHFEAFERKANISITTHLREPLFLRNSLRVMTFLSDDVLFNTISMLDYTGNLVSYVLEGPNEQNRKWNGTVKAARDLRSRTGQSAAGRAMAALHTDWVDRLHQVRSNIIHQRMALGDSSQTINIDLVASSFKSALSFQLPRSVTRKLQFLQPVTTDGRVDLVVGTEKIALHAIDAASQVTAALLTDLGGPFTPVPQSQE